VLAIFLRQFTIDQAFIGIFLDLRKEMSDQEIIALSLFARAQTPSFFKKLIAWLRRRPLDNPDQRMTSDRAAVSMGVSSVDYARYFTGGIQKIDHYLKRRLGTIGQ
jgi:hypothetical protein